MSGIAQGQLEMDEDLGGWIDSQTAVGKPAVLMVFDPGATMGFCYLANAPAFQCAAIVALDVPRQFATKVAQHLDFLWQEHVGNGKPIKAEQTSAQRIVEGYVFYRLRQPSAAVREALMEDELTQTSLRWPEADILLLEPVAPRSQTVH